MTSLVEKLALDKINKGLLRLVGEDLEYFHTGNRRWYKKKSNKHPESKRSRYHFVVGNGRSCVYKNRLLWMIENKKEIPDGYYVDHIDGDRTNDTVKNLQLMKAKESHKQGFNVALDSALWKLSRWFEIIGQHGREPTETEQFYIDQGF